MRLSCFRTTSIVYDICEWAVVMNFPAKVGLKLPARTNSFNMLRQRLSLSRLNKRYRERTSTKPSLRSRQPIALAADTADLTENGNSTLQRFEVYLLRLIREASF